MKNIETAVNWMIDIANNPAHGYDQIFRWGEKGDYDCSALVISAFKKSGFVLKGATYTGNMKPAFIKEGFIDVKNSIDLNSGKGLKRGDILLNIQHHVAVYIGNGQIVQASINEKGGAVGGKPGDQTGREINISPYRNYHRGGWHCILRYPTKSQNSINKPKEVLKVENGKYEIDGKKHEIPRVIIDGHQYVKLQTLRDLLNFKTEWVPETKVTVIKTK